MKKLILLLVIIISNNLESKNYIWRNPGYLNNITETAISNNKQYFAEALFGSQGISFIIWDLINKKQIYKNDSLAISSMDFTSDNKNLIIIDYKASDKKYYIKILDMDSFKILSNDTITRDIYNMKCLPNSNQIIYNYRDGFVVSFKIYDWKQKRIIDEFRLQSTSSKGNVDIDFQLSIDGRKLIQNYYTGYPYNDTVPFNNLIVYDLDIYKQYSNEIQPEKIYKFQITPDNSKIVTFGLASPQNKYSVYVLNANTLDTIKSFKGSLSLDGRYSVPNQIWLDNENLYLFYSGMGIYKQNLKTGIIERIIKISNNNKFLFNLDEDKYLSINGNELVFYKSSNDSNKYLDEIDRLKLYSGVNHTAELFTISITKDDKFILSAGLEKKIKVWDSENGDFKFEINSEEEVKEIQLTNDNKRILYLSYYQPQSIYITDFMQNASSKLLLKSTKYIDQVLISKNDSKMIFYYNDTLCVCDLENPSNIKKYTYGETIKHIQFSNNGKILVVACNYYIKFINFETMTEEKELVCNWYPMSIKFNHDDSMVAFGCSDGMVRGYNYEDLLYSKAFHSKTFVGNLRILMSVIYDVNFTKNNSYFIGNIAGWIKFWDYNDSEKFILYNDFYQDVYNVINPRIVKFVKSGDDSFLASIGTNGDIVKWTIPAPTSIKSDTKSPVSISPNPASDYIIIQNVIPPKAGIYVEIFNIFGEKVEQTNLSVQTSQTGMSDLPKIDISNFPAGVYFIRIGDKFEKFVKW